MNAKNLMSLLERTQKYARAINDGLWGGTITDERTALTAMDNLADKAERIKRVLRKRYGANV